MMSERVCPECSSTAARLRVTDRHRGYYECWACGSEYVVDLYA
jgi:transposase-like protein